MAYAEYETFLDGNDHSSRVFGEPETRRPYDGDVSPAALSFGSVNVGSTSTLIGTFKNVGYRSLPISAINAVGDYEITTTCPIGGELPVDGQCQISVRFKPVRAGTATGGVYVNTGNAAGAEFIRLTGVGVGGTVPPDPEPGDGWNHAAAVDQMLNSLFSFIQRSVQPALVTSGPVISLPNTTVEFETEVIVGAESQLVTFTIQNAGNQPMVLDNLNVSGEFELVP